MPKQSVSHTEYFDQVYRVLQERGALLLSVDPNGKPNPMTIGWGTIGIVWGRPVWVVLVRHSRYTYQCLEHTGDFTVNIPPQALSDVTEFCGTVSGRDHDKIQEQGLTLLPSETIKSPGIDECPIVYECKIVQKTDVVPENFDPEIIGACYPQGDFHRVYFGEILRVVADCDAAANL